MPFGRIAIALLALLLIPHFAMAQYQPPSDYLAITADKAFTWTDGPTNIVQLEGPVTIQTDRAKMTADRAVIWLTPLPGTVLDQRRAEIALLGHAVTEQQQIVRSGDSLFVTTEVRGTIRITADARAAQNLSDSDLYRDASSMRPLTNIAPGSQPPRTDWMVQRNWLAPPTSMPSTAPATQQVYPSAPVSFRAADVQTTQTPDDKVAVVLSGGVVLFQARGNGDFIELQSERAVLFTPLNSLRELRATGQFKRLEDAITAGYLEGDVRITFTPHTGLRAEQRLNAKSVYYEFATDRAVLTSAVIHTLEPTRQIPVVIRAHTIRQLSIGEYRANGAQLSTSAFATPSYSINADRAYIRQYDTGDPRLGQRTVFDARDTTFDLYNVPVFYWPWLAGSMTDRGTALRQLQFGSSRGFGPGIRTEWGFFETIGQPPPQDLDISYHLDYFGDRGPAGGVDAKYGGGIVTETTKQPWNFEGDFTSYFAQDHGEDRLGRERRLVTPDDETRYHVLWQHQHFFPEDWQVQLRAGVASDPTFLEEWFQSEFDEGLPHDVSAYVKRQRQTEALTLLVQFQPNDFVTTADLLQEQFEVERLPEIGYYRIGDSFDEDRFTFFSANTVSGLHFKQSSATLAELGFRTGDTPGIPSLGTTGVTDDTVYRGDFRQEIDYPFNAGQFRFVPYVMGRYVPYSDSPDGSSQQRVFVGTGLRITTAFWKVDDSALSDLFDIHRLRHVVEPELHLFTSAQTVDRSDVFIYDEPVDAINDITAAQIALHQRWQTKRGGAGQWRSVDLFALNVEGNFFLNQPDETILNPAGFRGLFFPSLPEASVARNSINADALWRISDSTALLSDIQYNLDELTLATTSVGLAVQRDTRLSYFMGARYIGQINSTIASLGAYYELTAKYRLSLSQSFNFSTQQNETSAVTLIRRFDRFFMNFTFFYDAVNDESGFRFGLFPEGLGYGLSSDQLQRALGPRQ